MNKEQYSKNTKNVHIINTCVRTSWQKIILKDKQNGGINA